MKVVRDQKLEVSEFLMELLTPANCRFAEVKGTPSLNPNCYLLTADRVI